MVEDSQIGSSSSPRSPNASRRTLGDVQKMMRDAYILGIKVQNYSKHSKSFHVYTMLITGHTRFMNNNTALDGKTNYPQDYIFLTRYSELATLHTQLTMEFDFYSRVTNSPLPPFPKKSAFSFKTKQFLEKRRGDLDNYFQTLFAMFGDKMRYSIALNNFFAPNEIELVVLGATQPLISQYMGNIILQLKYRNPEEEEGGVNESPSSNNQIVGEYLEERKLCAQTSSDTNCSYKRGRNKTPNMRTDSLDSSGGYEHQNTNNSDQREKHWNRGLRRSKSYHTPTASCMTPKNMALVITDHSEHLEEGMSINITPVDNYFQHEVEKDRENNENENENNENENENENENNVNQKKMPIYPYTPEHSPQIAPNPEPFTPPATVTINPTLRASGECPFPLASELSQRGSDIARDLVVRMDITDLDNYLPFDQITQGKLYRVEMQIQLMKNVNRSLLEVWYKRNSLFILIFDTHDKTSYMDILRLVHNFRTLKWMNPNTFPIFVIVGFVAPGLFNEGDIGTTNTEHVTGAMVRRDLNKIFNNRHPYKYVEVNLDRGREVMDTIDKLIATLALIQKKNNIKIGNSNTV